MGGMGGFEQYFSEDLDINGKIEIPFETSILGGKQHCSINGDSFDIKIPSGIKNGETIRIKGKGKKRKGGSGDLLLKVSIGESEEYTRDGNDIYKKINVSLKTALFGGKIDVNTLQKDVTIKIPKDTKNGQKIRLKELGASDRKSGKSGDLYLEVNVILPKSDSLSNMLSELLEKELS